MILQLMKVKDRSIVSIDVYRKQHEPLSNLLVYTTPVPKDFWNIDIKFGQLHQQYF